jgi:His-Xaa-Ser system protein HxsD
MPESVPQSKPIGVSAPSQLANAGQPVAELTVDRGLFTDDTVMRAAYWFTDRCHMQFEQLAPDRLLVRFYGRAGVADAGNVAGDFANELLNQRLRDTIARETASIRELIVAQAFAESELRSSSSQRGTDQA